VKDIAGLLVGCDSEDIVGRIKVSIGGDTGENAGETGVPVGDDWGGV